MKKFIPVLLILPMFYMSAMAQTTGWSWVRTSSYGGSGNAITHDKNGNLYVTGVFDQPNVTIGNRILYSYGSTDVFVAKYDAQGNLLWAHSARENGPDEATGIAVDSSGDVFITGSFIGPSMMFDSVTVTGVGDTCFFVAKYDSTGYIQWARSSGGGNLYCKGQCVTADEAGNCYVAGSYIGAGFSIGSYVLPHVEHLIGIFIAKYNTNGSLQWAQWANGPGLDQANAITTDNSGSIYITGTSTSGGVSFPGGYILSSPVYGYNFPFIFRLTTNSGALGWAKALKGYATGTGICVGPGNNLYLSGYLFGDTLRVANTNISGGPGNVFVARYSNSGVADWVVGSTGGGITTGPAISAGSDGNLYLAGQFSSPTIQFGNFTLTLNGTSPNSNMFAASIDTTGNTLWALSAGADSAEALYGIAAGDSGQAYVCGTAGTSFKAGNINVNCTGQDIFIAKLGTPAAATAGIPKLELNEDVNIYPNPTTGLLNITVSGFQPQWITIYDIQGRTVTTQSYAPRINMGNLTAGIYFVEVMNEDVSARQKVVKFSSQ